MSTNKKQWIPGIALIVVIGLLVWQLWGMIAGDSHSPKETVAKQILVKKLSQQKPVPAQWEQKPLVSVAEERYLQLAAEIQQAKMQHQLLQQKVAIAEAEKKLALSHQQVLGLSTSSSADSSVWSDTSAAHSSELHLLYLAKVSDEGWQATLRDGATMMHVQRGSALGQNGKVIAIQQSGLWFEDKAGKHWLGFPGDPIPAMPVDNSVSSSSVPAALEPMPTPAAPSSVPPVSSLPATQSHSEEMDSKKNKLVVAVPQTKERIDQKTAFEQKLVKSPDWWRSSDLLHSQSENELADNNAKLEQRRQLNSDELLFLEQPAEGVTLLAPAGQSFEQLKQIAQDDEAIGGSYELRIAGKKQWAFGSFRSAGAARFKALTLQQEQPGLQLLMPMSIKLVQESVLRG